MCFVQQPYVHCKVYLWRVASSTGTLGCLPLTKFWNLSQDRPRLRNLMKLDFTANLTKANAPLIKKTVKGLKLVATERNSCFG